MGLFKPNFKGELRWCLLFLDSSTVSIRTVVKGSQYPTSEHLQIDHPEGDYILKPGYKLHYEAAMTCVHVTTTLINVSYTIITTLPAVGDLGETN